MDDLFKRVNVLGAFLDVEGRRSSLSALQQKRLDPRFWDDPEAAQITEKEISIQKRWVEAFEVLERRRDDILTLQQLQAEEEDADLAGEIEKETATLVQEVEALEIRGMLSGEDDHRDAIVNINPGAGGTEAQDWAEMLLRMYTRYGEQSDWTVTLLERQEGEGAGIKSATLRIEGDMAYGYLKAESGVHRLVRISPFDSSGRRHTSFASVFVFPEIDENIEVDLSTGELELQRFHSGGKGGQNVNKVETGVRYVWIGELSNGERVRVAAESTEERGQLQNRERSLAMLKSRIYGMEQQIREAAKSEMEGSKKKIEWGSQIRSYVFQPYTMVNDLRTDTKITDVQGVMDGNLEPFIKAYLLQETSSPDG